MITTQEIQETLDEIIRRDRCQTLDGYVDMLPCILESDNASRVIDVTIDRLAARVLDPKAWVVLITGIFMMGIEIGLRIAEKRSKIDPKHIN